MVKTKVTIKINPLVKEKLEAKAAAQQENLSEIIRQALNHYLENNVK